MKKTTRYIAIALTVGIVLFLLYTFSRIVAYVLVAWVLSMIGQPLMRFYMNELRLGKFRPNEDLAAALTLLTFYVILGCLGTVFVPLVTEQAANLMRVNYNEIAEALAVPINQVYDTVRNYGFSTGEGTPADQLRSAFGDFFSPELITDFFGSAISVISNIVIAFFSITFISFFFLKDSGIFTKAVSVFVPSEYEDKVRNAVSDTTKMLSRYFGGIIIQISVFTFLVWIGLSLLGIKNALLIAFFAALINVIPYLGPLIGAVFAVLLTVSSSLDLSFYDQMLPLLFKVTAVFAVMQLIDNFLLQPYIFSASVNAHPLEVFIIILMGAQINGIIGMVLAIPVYTVLRVIAMNFLSEFKIVQKLTRGMYSVKKK